jgi:hypothetical protein
MWFNRIFQSKELWANYAKINGNITAAHKTKKQVNIYIYTIKIKLSLHQKTNTQ